MKNKDTKDAFKSKKLATSKKDSKPKPEPKHNNLRTLWDKGGTISKKMHEFTVGSDPIIDLKLVEFDCEASIAHAKMLEKIGILTSEEVNTLSKAIHKAKIKSQKGEFVILPEQEDCHTALEMFLVEECGDVGKKIHTGRSRNDQVATAVRLYMLSEVREIQTLLGDLYREIKRKDSKNGHIPMPGFTHLQSAMPSSFGQWLQALSFSCYEMMEEGQTVYTRLNKNPLGSAAGFGSGLPLDRDYTAKLLGFDTVHESYMSVQNTRGAYEERLLFWCKEIASVLEKFANDVVFFCCSEVGFFKLPNELTTGSSIMPQKRNPDVAELLRGNSGVVFGALNEVSYIRAKLLSSYHRDFQLLKEPLFRGIKTVRQMIEIAALIVEGLEPQEETLNNAMKPELYATYEAYKLVLEGVPFRDAYREVAKKVEEGKIDVLKLQEFYKRVV